MSVEAITWAITQNIKHSSAKFVLVMLANCADGQEFIAWPSVAYLSESTGQDRKTVLENLKRLRESGFIEDTGERKGSTKQVSVYRLKCSENGTVKEAQKRNSTAYVNDGSDTSYGIGSHYVYRLTNPATGQFYIGVRSCVGDSADDISYLGSGRWPSLCATSGLNLSKVIDQVFADRKSAEAWELELIDSLLSDPLCMNSTKTGTVSVSQTVPNFPINSPVIPVKQSRFSVETVPKTGHGTVKEPSIEPSRKQKRGADAPPCPDDVEKQVYGDWLKLREGKKATVSGTVLKEARREADKAGLTLQRFLEIWCARGSQGLQAEWLKPNERAGSFTPANTSKYAGAAKAIWGDNESRTINA